MLLFRVGKYAPAVRKHIEANPDFVQPEARRKDVFKMLDDAEEIEKIIYFSHDVDWGVDLPEGFDEGHVRVQCLSWRGDGVDATRATGRALRPGRRATTASRDAATGGLYAVDRERQQRATRDGVDGVDREPRVDWRVDGVRRKNDKNTTAGHALDGSTRSRTTSLVPGDWASIMARTSRRDMGGGRGHPRHRQRYCSISCHLLAGVSHVRGAALP